MSACRALQFGRESLLQDLSTRHVVSVFFAHNRANVWLCKSVVVSSADVLLSHLLRPYLPMNNALLCRSVYLFLPSFSSLPHLGLRRQRRGIA